MTNGKSESHLTDGSQTALGDALEKLYYKNLRYLKISVSSVKLSFRKDDKNLGEQWRAAGLHYEL